MGRIHLLDHTLSCPEKPDDGHSHVFSGAPHFRLSYLTSTGKTVVSLISSMTKEAETSDSGTLAINR